MAYKIKINRTTESRIAELDENNIGFGRVFADHMFVVDYDKNGWTNPRIEPYGSMLMSPATSVLHYGQSVFEGMKAFSGRDGILLFRPVDNWKRLNISAGRMVMPEIPENLFMSGLKTLINLDQAWIPKTRGSSLYIRPFMFSTDEFIGVKPSENYRFVIFCCPVGPYYNKPLKVKVEEEFSRAAPGGTGFAKCSGNYGGSLYAMKKAQDQGFDQVLWTDSATHQFVEETGTTNFFAVIGNKVLTPPLGKTLLAGITRDSVIRVIRDMGVIVEERPVTVEELKEAFRNGEIQELFITGTAATLVNIEAFGHNGDYFDVLQNGNCSLSMAVKKTLDDIRYGEIQDKFNWCEEVLLNESEAI